MTTIGNCTARGTAVVLFIGLVGAGTLSACGESNRVAAMQSRNAGLEASPSSAPTYGQSDPESPARLRPDTLAALRHGGTDAKGVDEKEAGITREEAVKQATREFGFVNERKPVEVGLARVTDHSYGERVETGDPASPSRTTLFIDDRLVWVVIFDQVDVPVLGGSQGKGNETETERVSKKPTNTSFMVLIDGSTGKYLRATTFFRGDATLPPDPDISGIREPVAPKKMGTGRPTSE